MFADMVKYALVKSESVCVVIEVWEKEKKREVWEKNFDLQHEPNATS